MSATVTFPDRQAILDYIRKHPGNFLLEAPIIAENFPRNTLKIATFFANKQMTRGKIYAEVLEAIATKDLTHCIMLKIVAEEIVEMEKSLNSLKESTEPIAGIVQVMKNNLTGLKEPILFFKLAVRMYSRVLRDLGDGMPPDKVNAAIEALRQKRLEKMQ